MKQLSVFFLLLCSMVYGQQQIIPADTVVWKDIADAQIDDLNNLFLYNSQEQSFTKYDAGGLPVATIGFRHPFRVQSVQNSLRYPAFSQNLQELCFLDARLTVTEKIKFPVKLGFILAVFVEDLQEAWLLEESRQRLIQYNYREDQILQEIPFPISFAEVNDFLIYRREIFLLTKNALQVYNLRGQLLKQIPVENARRLRRENKTIFVLTDQAVLQLSDDVLQITFTCPHCRYVDKNSTGYLGMTEDKLYLYPLKKEAVK